MTYLVGLYPALLRLDLPESERVYATLREHELVAGFEIPFRTRWSAEDLRQVARDVGNHSQVVITTIPGLVVGSRANPTFGPASLDPAGRQAAVDFVKDAWQAAERLGDIIGPDRITGVAITSAPRASRGTIVQGASAFSESLQAIASWFTTGTQLMVEHCDAFTEAHSMDKGYLPLEYELNAIRGANRNSAQSTVVVLNWGRTTIEAQDSAEVPRQLRTTEQAGVLGGLVFSGCSDVDSEYGPAWADVHLPPADEVDLPVQGTGSLLTRSAMSNCLAELPERESAFVGLKVTPPRWADVDQRIDILLNSLQILSRAERTTAEQTATAL